MINFELDNNYKDVLGKYNGNEKIVRVPNDISQISSLAFCQNTSVEQVILPAGLKIISPYAFEGCTNLVEVNIPESVEVIKRGAFRNCKKLEHIVIPETTTVHRCAFYGCIKLIENWEKERLKTLWENEYVTAYLEEHFMEKLRRLFLLCVYSDNEEKQVKAHEFLLSVIEQDRQYAALYVIITAVLVGRHDSDLYYFPLDKACAVFAQFDLEEDCRELAAELEEELREVPEIDDLLIVIKDYLFGLS